MTRALGGRTVSTRATVEDVPITSAVDEAVSSTDVASTSTASTRSSRGVTMVSNLCSATVARIKSLFETNYEVSQLIVDFLQVFSLHAMVTDGDNHRYYRIPF